MSKKDRNASELDAVLSPLGSSREKEVKEGLSAIFRDEKGDMPDLATFDRQRSNVWLIILSSIAGFIAILLVAVWFGFSIFKPFSGFTGKGLSIVIDGPERVALGQEMTYFINYQDLAAEPLASADIRVSFPPDFSVTHLDPEPSDQGLVWQLGSIPLDGRGTITVKGVFTGALGSHNAIQAVGTYRPASFNSDFEALATKDLEYAESVVNGSLDVPQKVLPGDRVRIAYHVENTGTLPIKALEARVTLPQGFVRDASSTGELDENTVRLPVGDLASAASSTMEIQGSFVSGVSGNVPVHAEIGSIGIDGTFQPVQKTDAIVAVESGDLLLNLVANGADTDRSVAMGDILRFAVGYQNTAAEDISKVTVRVTFEPIGGTSGTQAAIVSSSAKKPVKKTPVPATPPPTYVDWSQLDETTSGTVSGNVITWDSAAEATLDRLSPSEDGLLEFSVPVATSTASSTPPSGFQVTAEATMESVGGVVVKRTVRTRPMVFKIRSDAAVASEARYFTEEGAPIGSGPLPPVSGATTTYRIFWDVSKTIHGLDNIKVGAVLPKNVSWTGTVSTTAGEISYDATSRNVTWSVNRLPADVDGISSWFDVTLTPTELDIGRFADLLGEARLDASDADIGEPIVKIASRLTTDLENDDGAKNKGVVRKP